MLLSVIKPCIVVSEVFPYLSIWTVMNSSQLLGCSQKNPANRLVYISERAFYFEREEGKRHHTIVP